MKEEIRMMEEFDSDSIVFEDGDLLDTLPEIGAVVVDGDWLEKYRERLLSKDPDIAAKAGREAILDEDTLDPHMVLDLIMNETSVHFAAIAAALREVWIGHGLLPYGAVTVCKIFRETRREAESYLMQEDELYLLQQLPEIVTCWRGQRFDDGAKTPTSISWSLQEKVADWHAAPIPSINRPHGWVLQAKVPKSAILALFTERGEDEVLLDRRGIEMRRSINFPVKSRRGKADDFPAHLSAWNWRQPADK